MSISAIRPSTSTRSRRSVASRLCRSLATVAGQGIGRHHLQQRKWPAAHRCRWNRGAHNGRPGQRPARLCPETPAGPGSAQDNFDVLWQAMEEHYAFFDLHGVDWAERRDTFRPADDAELGDGELFELFKQPWTGWMTGIYPYGRRMEKSTLPLCVRTGTTTGIWCVTQPSHSSAI